MRYNQRRTTTTTTTTMMLLLKTSRRRRRVRRTRSELLSLRRLLFLIPMLMHYHCLPWSSMPSSSAVAAAFIVVGEKKKNHNNYSRCSRMDQEVSPIQARLWGSGGDGGATSTTRFYMKHHRRRGSDKDMNNWNDHNGGEDDELYDEDDQTAAGAGAGAGAAGAAEAAGGDGLESFPNYNEYEEAELVFGSAEQQQQQQQPTANDEQQQQQQQQQEEEEENEDEILGYAIDAFLRGDYDREYAVDAPAPHPGLTSPGSVIDAALRSLRDLDDPNPSHGAAVLMRFCLPLSRSDRWGGGGSSTRKNDKDQWKQIMRGALTPSMLARRIRASEQFSSLLDWQKLDVTEGSYAYGVGGGRGSGGDGDNNEDDRNDRDDDDFLVETPSIAYVNAALYFGDSGVTRPKLIQFTLRRRGGVWLIESAREATELAFGTAG